MYSLLVWIIYGITLNATVQGACESGWVHFQDSCYTLVTAFRQWKDAKGLSLSLSLWSDHAVSALKFCENMNNTHLPIVMSEEENEFLKQLLRTRHATGEVQFWMDGSDLNKEGEWKWNSTGEGFEVTDWYPGEPNQSNGEEDCLTFYTRYDMRWNDEHCDRLFPFLCEKESVGAGIFG